MKTLFITFIITFFIQLSFAQEIILSNADYNGSGAAQLMFVDCKRADSLFQRDLQRNTVFLLLQGGIAPTIRSGDIAFQNKYKVYFYDFGCSGPNQECMERYNFLAFTYLRKKYGKAWIKEIREDVIGLKDWEKGRAKGKQRQMM